MNKVLRETSPQPTIAMLTGAWQRARAVVITCCIALALYTSSFAQTALRDMTKVVLQTAGGGTFAMNQILKNKASVFVFYSPECPICNHFTLKLDSIYHRYAGKGVGFYLVFTDRDMKPETIRAYASSHRLGYGLLLDTDRKLTNALAAKVTPEAFVVAKSGKTTYRGRIDDYYVGLGRYRTTGATTNELSDAIAATLATRAVRVSETKPIGCYITRVLSQ